MFVPFDQLSPFSRIWIYPSDQLMSEQTERVVGEELTTFVSNWMVHGEPLRASYQILNGHFVLLGAEEQTSGCSIDTSVRMMKEIGIKIGGNFLDRTNVFFLINDDVLKIPISQLRNQFNQGKWNAKSLVFNLLLERKGDLSEQWLQPASATWVKKYLPVETVTDKPYL